MIKCADCQGKIIGITAYPKWLRLLHFIEIQYSEENITLATYENLMNDLMGMKYLVDQHEGSKCQKN